jgi:hypothetical protein
MTWHSGLPRYHFPHLQVCMHACMHRYAVSRPCAYVHGAFAHPQTTCGVSHSCIRSQ